MSVKFNGGNEDRKTSGKLSLLWLQYGEWERPLAVEKADRAVSTKNAY